MNQFNILRWDYYTNVSSSTQTNFSIDGVSCVKIDSTGFYIYTGSDLTSEWWNLKNKIQDILNKWADLDARHIVFETQ